MHLSYNKNSTDIYNCVPTADDTVWDDMLPYLIGDSTLITESFSKNWSSYLFSLLEY